MKEKGLLLYIINHCVRVEEKMKTIDKKDFDSSEDIQEIVCFNNLQIGELAKGLDSNFTNIHDKVQWKSIKGMRDGIVHGYGTSDTLPPLKEVEASCSRSLMTPA